MILLQCIFKVGAHYIGELYHISFLKMYFIANRETENFPVTKESRGLNY